MLTAYLETVPTGGVSVSVSSGGGRHYGGLPGGPAAGDTLGAVTLCHVLSEYWEAHHNQNLQPETL